MKEGLIRIDEVGRVVIPKEARKVLKIGDNIVFVLQYTYIHK